MWIKMATLSMWISLLYELFYKFKENFIIENDFKTNQQIN